MDSPTTEDGSPFGDIPTRPMRVKVLYSFDNENKTNCLARFPDTLHIPAVAIDENSQVGVIELRQCIQAIVGASPELLSRLAEGDFTIYAYDYSEYETPLVGQGMLSVALAAASPTPLVPAHQSKTMITGRVCKNLPGIFSNGVKETLEVKLRLVPVPKQVQNEYVRNMESFRSMSPATSAGFDPNAWNASFNPPSAQTPNNDYFQFDGQSRGGQRDQSLIDDIFGLGSGNAEEGSGQRGMGGVGMAQTPSDALSGANPAFAAHSHSAPGSRAGSPMMGSNSNSFNEQLRHQSFSASGANYADQSRPGSRGSVMSESHQPSHHYRQHSAQPMDMPQQTEVEYNEDGQPRKRAKVMQTDWRGRSSFGAKSSDLRVTAATAASMHMHRPVATRPFAPGSNLEPPPRVPTPVPQFNQQSQQRPRQSGSRSLLRQASTAGSDFMSDFDQMSETVGSSPEDFSPENSMTAEGTPQEFPSSPPLFPGINLPQPSSPGLPTLPPPRMADSGYMSERNLQSGNYLDHTDNDNEDRSPDAQDYEAAGRYQPRNKQRQPRIKSEGAAVVGMPPSYPSDAPTSEINIEMERPGDMKQLPNKMRLNLPPGRGRDPSMGPRPSTAKKPSRVNSPARSMTPVPAINNIQSSSLAPPAPIVGGIMHSQAPSQSQSLAGSEPPQSRRGSLALPTQRPAPIRQESEAAAVPPKAAKKRPAARRARTTYNDSECGSPAPSDTESRGPGRSGSGAQRRKLIEQRMHDAVAKGEMPPYCVHCGSIETPTWRRMYFKVVEGKPSGLDAVEGEGETVGVENLEFDPVTGEVTKFIIRKTMKKVARDEAGEGFGDIQLCNPCGLWFNKSRAMRPKEKWGKKSGTRKSKKTKAGEVGVATDGLEPQSEAFFTDAPMPEDAADDSRSSGNALLYDSANGSQNQHAHVQRPRAQSLQPSQRSNNNSQWDASQLDAALNRAIQSSPARFHGSQESPIELDELTPRPTRRLLFPSPRRNGEAKSLDGNEGSSRNSTSPANKSTNEKLPSPSKNPSSHVSPADYAIFEAFTTDKENMPPPLDSDDDLAHLFLGSPTSIFKTPRKTPPSKNQVTFDHLLKTPTPASRKRKLLTPSAAAANNASQNPTHNATANDFLTSPSSSRYFLRSTPTRLANTPGRRSLASGLGSDPASQQVSPFSRHLAQMISNASGAGEGLGSPNGGGGQFDFGDLPGFGTPGRGNVDWEGLMSGDLGGVFEDGNA